MFVRCVYTLMLCVLKAASCMRLNTPAPAPVLLVLRDIRSPMRCSRRQVQRPLHVQHALQGAYGNRVPYVLEGCRSFAPVTFRPSLLSWYAAAACDTLSMHVERVQSRCVF
jgi:hypothetical protein